MRRSKRSFQMSQSGKKNQHPAEQNSKLKNIERKVLTLFLDGSSFALQRNDSFTNNLPKMEYPQVVSCQDFVTKFPIDEFPGTDPYLPWIHDYFRKNQTHVMVIAQNKGRCNTGITEEQEQWEPHLALFQPVSISLLEEGHGVSSVRYRFTSYENATCPETRFLCTFHTTSNLSRTTCSVFPFNYEYISYRKNQKTRKEGNLNRFYDYSTLLFSCPIPDEFQQLFDDDQLYLDITPIRTPLRVNSYLFVKGQHVPDIDGNDVFDPSERLDTETFHDPMQQGRWANLPICSHNTTGVQLKSNNLVACTWTASSYKRRGDEATVDESSGSLLQEWIAFHQLVGFDHIYIYDNSGMNSSTLQNAIHGYENITYHKWPATVCNNNRPNHPNPGERSSQYAAEASCRERYGHSTNWMAFFDIDEYFVPLKNDTFEYLLQDMALRDVNVLKFRSSRGRPRLDFMEVPERSFQEKYCKPNMKKKIDTAPCVISKRDISRIQLYNCDYIKPPRPYRFQRAMKQIFRPSFVLSHFVHYTTVTQTMAQYFRDTKGAFKLDVKLIDQGEVFVDEVEEGIMIHAKAILPAETMSRNSTCFNGSKKTCPVGIPCPASVPFDDTNHQMNPFRDNQGNFCNCWVNEKLEHHFLPLLQKILHT